MTVNKYNNTFHSLIKMMLIDAKSRSYIVFGSENNH